MARPADAQAKMDKKEFEGILKLFASKKEAADWFGVSESTIERYCRKEYECSFEALRDKYFVKTRIALKRKALQLALEGKGNTAIIIYLCKSLLGMADTPSQSVTIEPVKYASPSEQLEDFERDVQRRGK